MVVSGASFAAAADVFKVFGPLSAKAVFPMARSAATTSIMASIRFTLNPPIEFCHAVRCGTAVLVNQRWSTGCHYLGQEILRTADQGSKARFGRQGQSRSGASFTLG